MAEKRGEVVPERLRVAVVGCGVIGKLHTQRLLADPRVEVRALCDPSPGVAQSLAKSLQLDCDVFTSTEQLYKNTPINAVVLCTPTTIHHQQVVEAMEADLHVLCEKPLATTREQITDLIQRSQRSNKVFSIAYQRRYQSPYVTARRELTERKNQYGKVRQVHLFVCERWAQTIKNTWRDDPKVGAGYFGDAGTHQVDSVFFITDARPETVLARSDRRGYSVEIVTEVFARLTDGIDLVAHFVGDAHHWREDIHFHCDKADLLIRSEAVFCCRENRVEAIEDPEPDSDPDRGFVDAILTQSPTPSPPQCALPMWQWTDAVLRSVRDGVEVTCNNG